LLLHARQLAFTHPRSGKKIGFTVPLPDDFEAAMTALRIG